MVVNPPPNFCKYFYIKKYASIFSHPKSNFAAITHSLNQGQNFLHIYFYTLVDPFYEVTVSANELQSFSSCSACVCVLLPQYELSALQVDYYYYCMSQGFIYGVRSQHTCVYALLACVYALLGYVLLFIFTALQRVIQCTR